MLPFSQILVLFTITFVLVGLSTPLMRKLALKANFVDNPIAAHKSHLEPVPYLGGISIALGVTIVICWAIFTQDNLIHNFRITFYIFVPSIALGLVGLVDDLKTLQPLPRFIAQSVAGIFTSIVIIGTDTVGNPTGNPVIDSIVTTTWIIGITNSINFFDNLDGGAAGAIATCTFGLFLITQSNGQSLISAFSISIFAAMLGFLIWNKSPAKIYMGDAGALFLGTLVAVLTIRLEPDVGSELVSLTTPILLLALPIMDSCVAIFSRIRRRKSIFEGGKDHLSHRLIRKGFTKRQTVYLLWTLSAIFSSIAAVNALIANSLFLLLLTGIFWLVLLVIFLQSTDE
jgi:UDP-GlcNAc:undecaprenyl-phosphate/decaprenyl-phosphate GlcNAc-1-phosphate transferase